MDMVGVDSTRPEPRAVFRFDLSGVQARTEALRCRATLAALGDGPSPARLACTAQLVAAELEGDPDAALRAADAVRELAEALGTPHAEAYALAVRGLVDHAPDTVGARVGNARRIIAIAHREAPELAAVGHFLLLTSLLEQGELRALDIELSPHGETVGRFPELLASRHAQWFRCLRAILDGRTAEAERLADAILAGIEAEGDVAGHSTWVAQLGTIRWMQGRIHEMEPLFLAARHAHPQQALWQLSLAWLWQSQGREEAARALLAEGVGLDALPRDRTLLATLTMLGELASRIGTVEEAEELRTRLLPHARQAAPVGLGLAFWGTVAHTLGLLAVRLGRTAEARLHFRTAIEVSARGGAQAWLVQAQLSLAEFELTHGGDPSAATELARQAEATSEALGFPALLVGARMLLARVPHAADAHGVAGVMVPPACDGARVRVLGVFEVDSCEGEPARWTSRKARELLKMLVARRGVAVARETLMHALWPDQAPEQLANRFAVALSTVRRALDPARRHPVQRFVVADGAALRLDTQELRVDVEEFLASARGDDLDALRAAVELYTGDAFADEPYAEWASGLRHDAQTAFCAAAREVAEHDAASGDFVAASELFRRVLEIEPLDERVHRGLVTTLHALGARGQAREVESRWRRAQEELAG